MKKITLLLGIASFMTIVACKKETTTIETTAPATENTADVPPPPVPTVKDTVTDGTAISVNADGIKVDSKDGGKKTEVNVSGGDSSIEIKR